MKKENLFILAGNGPYNNRGCEAIVRGTVECLRRNFDNPKFIIISAFKNKNQYLEQKTNEHDKDITHRRMTCASKRFQFIWWINSILKVLAPKLTKYLIYKNILSDIPKATAVLSIGGDNYSLDYADNAKTYTDLDDLVLSFKKPMIIWGASVGPFSRLPAYEKYMSEHLQPVHVFLRESISIEYLNSIGKSDKVYKMADPAFIMQSKKPDHFETSFIEGTKKLGLNFSPLMSKFVTNGDSEKWSNMCINIIDTILDTTDVHIYLIPHVIGNPGNDDYIFLKNLLSKISKHKNRIQLLPPSLNAINLKWVISKMSVFAGARTHSTIAGFSSLVPTLSFAYSLKAKGLNKDIYGHLDYCIYPEDLTAELAVTKLQEMLAASESIKSELEATVPSLANQVLQAGNLLKSIVIS